MISKIVSIIEYFIPNTVLNWYRGRKILYKISLKHKEYKIKLQELSKNNKPIKVVFLAIIESVWKYDSLYKLLSEDPLFEPIVMICPQVDIREDLMYKQLYDTYDAYKKKGYNVILSYDQNRNGFIDLSELCPDILMYTNPYKEINLDKYYISNVHNVLTCYISYYYPKGVLGYHEILERFESLLWKNFLVSELDKSRIKYNDNCFVTGYPMYDSFLNCIEDDNKSSWKINNKKLKRIIWAPYHMIDKDCSNVQMTTFLQYSERMLELAVKYKEKAQFVFKPHPLLKSKLEKHPLWGINKTKEYYDKWLSSENTSFVNGEYIELFKTSDAMIHDCGSFAVEYLYVNKPVMYLTNGNAFENLEPIGCKAISCHYIGKSIDEIDEFINNIVNGFDDVKKEERVKFINTNLVPPNGVTAGMNMYNVIKQFIQVNI